MKLSRDQRSVKYRTPNIVGPRKLLGKREIVGAPTRYCVGFFTLIGLG